MGNLSYESVTSKRILEVDENITFSNFMIIDEGLKSTALLKLANFHGIPANQCFMVDDTPHVITDVKKAGIHTISLECFHHSVAKPWQLNDALYVWTHLNRFSKELKQKLEDIAGIKWSLLSILCDRLRNLTVGFNQTETSVSLDNTEVVRFSYHHGQKISINARTECSC